MANPTNKSGTEHTSSTQGTTGRTSDQNQNRGGSQSMGHEKEDGGLMTAAREKVQEAASTVADVAGKAKDTVREWAGQATDKAKEFGQTAYDTAGEWGTAAKDKAQEWGEDLTGMVRRYPIPAIFIGLGIGFMLGSMMRR